MLIGERPGKQDVQSATPAPYSGIAGQELSRYLSHGGITRDQAFITFLVRDYNGGEPPVDDEVVRDQRALCADMLMVEPTIIGAMGKHVVEWFLGPVDMEKIHGVPTWYIHPDIGPTILVPITHPPSGFYSSDNQPQIIDDFMRLGRVVRGELCPVDPPSQTSYRESNWINPFTPGTVLGADTEGWKRNPWGGSVSWKDGVGVVFRRGDASVDILAYQIAQAAEHDPRFRVYLHNSLHDLDVLHGLGVDLPEGCYRDTMVYAYLLATEPQGLKPLSYRWLGAHMRSYDDVTGPYYRAVFEEYIRTAAELDTLPDWEEQYVIIENGAPKIKRPWGIARHIRRLLKDADKAQLAGTDFDFAKRWDNIDDYKKVSVIQVIGDPPEQSLDYVPDDEAIAYAGEDAIQTRRLGPILEAEIIRRGFSTVSAIDHGILPIVNRMQRTGFLVDPDHFDRLAEECTAEMSRLQSAIQSLTGALINPDSGDQVAELLYGQLKLDAYLKEVVGLYDIPTTESGERFSTNDKLLEALRYSHPVVPLVCDYRETSKVRSSFCWPIARLARRDPERRLHPNLRVTRVSSGRISCVRPNLMAIPVRSKLGLRVRDGFIPGPGHVLTDHDLDQVEMRYMGDESRDPVLMDCFFNQIDVHSKTASLVFGIDIRDVRANKVNEIRYRYPAKRIGFGVITQITGHGLKAQMDLAGATKDGVPLASGGAPWSEDDCDRLIAEYFKVHSRVQGYIFDCHAEVRRRGGVSDRWGRWRPLPGIHSPIKWIQSEALRAASSHKIQGGAQGIMKLGMAQVWACMKQWWFEQHYVEPVLQIHDSLNGEIEDNMSFWEEYDFMVRNCLTQTYLLPSGIPLGAAGNRGRTWGELK